MSRVGKKEIIIPKSVSLKQDEAFIYLKGPKGEMTYKKSSYLNYNISDSVIKISSTSQEKFIKSLYGLHRALLFSYIKGVSEGFTKKLEIVGVGFKAQVNGSVLNLQLGYSHPINYMLPKLVTAKVDNNVKITLESCDKQLLGEVAATIRGFRKPEPYKGKGIKYEDEVIVRKQGKTAGK